MSNTILERAASPNFEQAVFICKRYFEGVKQHIIAAELGMNQGRISEVVNGRRHPDARKIALGNTEIKTTLF